MPYKKPSKYLKRKNIKRKTGGRAQSKQILALTKQVSRITKSNYETVMTVWNRPSLTCETAGAGTTAYICPIPISMCNSYSQNTILTAGDADQRIQWTDNLALAAMDNFRKVPLFGSSENARDSPEVTHLGSTLKYRFINEEPSFATYSVFLIRAKRRQATQLTVDRQLKNGTTLNSTNGAGAFLEEGADYITHPNVLGTDINRKYWTVLYKRTHNFSHPNATEFSTKVNPSNMSTRNNSVIAEGTIRIPSGGVIRCFNRQSMEVSGSPDMGNKKLSASQLGLVDEENSKTCYLVCINNGVNLDNETIKLSFLVKDVYKAVV